MDLAQLRAQAQSPATAVQSDLDGVANDLAAAFVDDPLYRWLLARGAAYDAARLSFLRVLVREFGFKTGRIDRPAAGGAAAIWIPSEAMGSSSLLGDIRPGLVLLRDCGLGGVARILKLRAATDAHHPHKPHDYLMLLGVRPEAQGAGVGSELLKAHLARLDARGRAAFLETAAPRNLALYGAHGFEVVEDYKAAPDAPTLWSMWRAPQSVKR